MTAQFTGSTITGFPGSSDDNLSAMRETQVWSLGLEDPLEKGMATHFGILAWRIPRTEGPDGLKSMGSQRVRHDWVYNSFFEEGNSNLLQYSCLENSMDIGAWKATVHGVAKSQTQLSMHTHPSCIHGRYLGKSSNSLKWPKPSP